jgi:hypothetical protein
MPVHTVSLVAMGLWMLDNCDLEECATTAAELGQWDFHLAVAPVRFAGTSGSPVNPIAGRDWAGVVGGSGRVASLLCRCGRAWGVG